jgi:molybdopterin converting factor small subunit
LKVLFYGRLAETIASELDMPGGGSVAELRERLIHDYPAAEPTLRSNHSRACVGDTLVGDDYPIGPDMTVELLPPVSGG